MLGGADGPVFVMNRGVGEADTVGAEADGGVVADPVGAGLLEEVDGGVEVRECHGAWQTSGCDSVHDVEHAQRPERVE